MNASTGKLDLADIQVSPKREKIPEIATYLSIGDLTCNILQESYNLHHVSIWFLQSGQKPTVVYPGGPGVFVTLFVRSQIATCWLTDCCCINCCALMTVAFFIK